MTACVNTIGGYGMNVRKFGIIKEFICTLGSMVQLGSSKLKLVHIKVSHMSTILGLYFLRDIFPSLCVRF